MLKKILKILSLTLLIIVVNSCGQESDEDCIEIIQEDGKDVCITGFRDDINLAPDVLRWMDRKIYFATPGGDPTENTELQKNRLREYIEEFEVLSGLGENYFSFDNFDQSLLNPLIFDENREEKDVKSFILFWNDARFDQFALERFNNNLPDPNAITVTNQEFNRKFYIILRASCFGAVGKCRLNGNGARALIARQLGFLVDLSEAPCESIPRNIMCTANVAETEQWEDANIQNFLSVFNNRLDVIKLNPNYYGDLARQPSRDRRWMSQVIYFSESVTNSNGVTYNTEIQKEKIRSALNQISCDTMLGCNYFTYGELPESSLPLLGEVTLSDSRFPSFIRILPDTVFSQTWQDLGGDEDVNAILVVNAAAKRQFQLIIRNSCFETNINCNGISSEEGLRALLARQLGRLAGLTVVDCDVNPNDVMCGDFPVNEQWELTNRNKWYAQFDNQLENILNIPSFYDEFNPVVEESDDE
jgi:hypothetical protein